MGIINGLFKSREGNLTRKLSYRIIPISFLRVCNLQKTEWIAIQLDERMPTIK